MTSRERVHLALARKTPDRLPFNFWMDRSRMAQLERELGANFRVSHYGADVIETFINMPFFSEITKNARQLQDDTTTWTLQYGASNLYPLRSAPLPDPDNPACYLGIRSDRLRYPDKALFALVPSPLEILFGVLGLEQLFYSLADYPNLADELCERISLVLLRAVNRILDCDVDVLYLAGDICSTRGAMLSEEMLRRFVFEPMQILIHCAHARGIPVFYHTDGYVMDILPLFVEYGIDGINPLQYSVGNDAARFAAEYGSKLMLYGGMDNCFILPHGSVDEIRTHIRSLFDILGKSGGFIASSHDIPADVPQENLDAMVQALQECRYGNPMP